MCWGSILCTSELEVTEVIAKSLIPGIKLYLKDIHVKKMCIMFGKQMMLEIVQEIKELFLRRLYNCPGTGKYSGNILGFHLLATECRLSGDRETLTNCH